MPADDPQAWLRFAEDDLAAAQRALELRSAFQPRHVCFDAQQAAEKALKALSLAEEIDFPFTHDLASLTRLLSPDSRPRASDADLQELTSWATGRRYPGGDEPAWADAERAVTVADGVIADARARLPTP